MRTAFLSRHQGHTPLFILKLTSHISFLMNMTDTHLFVSHRSYHIFKKKLFLNSYPGSVSQTHISSLLSPKTHVSLFINIGNVRDTNHFFNWHQKQTALLLLTPKTSIRPVTIIYLQLKTVFDLKSFPEYLWSVMCSVLDSTKPTQNKRRLQWTSDCSDDKRTKQDLQ